MIKIRPARGAWVVALAVLCVPVASGAQTTASARAQHVSGEKRDSGLGALPPYREWAHHPKLKALVVRKHDHRVRGKTLFAESRATLLALQQ